MPARTINLPPIQIGCWTIQVSYDGARSPENQERNRQDSFGGLCVDGGLGQSSWTSDGRWLVVQGRLPSEDRPSIYGLRMPGGTEGEPGWSAGNPYCR